MNTKVSVLDLMMIGEGQKLADTINGAKLLAQAVEKAGYERYWIAEHHDMPGVGSSATTLIMQHLANATTSLRIGAGGIMLPNHPTLIVAEEFATLDAIFPNRIDLGVGRAPGAAGAAVQAIRSHQPPRDFENDIQEIINYLEDTGKLAARGIREQHILPIYILGSSPNSAELAARLGLPYVFASHFAPRHLLQAVQLYRNAFRPSEVLKEPYIIAGVNVIAADTSEEAVFLASSHQKWVTQLYMGKAGLLPKPEQHFIAKSGPTERAILDDAMAGSAIGDKTEIQTLLKVFLQHTKADELIIDARIYDPIVRCRSYEIAAEAVRDL